MTGFVLTPRARADLEDIWDYTQAQWNAAQAECYLRGIERAIKSLARNPRLGRSCDEIRAGYFKFHTGSHVLFYRRKLGKIEVVRILHQRMDFERHL